MTARKELNWFEIIDEYNESGKTQKQFCNDNSLAYSTFSKKLNQNKVVNKNQPVFIATEIPNAKPQIKIEIGKCKIVITEFNKGLLLDLVEGISKLC
jgi:hypothetical protein